MNAITRRAQGDLITADAFVLVYIPPRCRTAAYRSYASFAEAAAEHRALKADETRGVAKGIFPSWDGMPVGPGFSAETIECAGGVITRAYPSLCARPNPDSPESKRLLERAMDNGGTRWMREAVS